MSSIVILVLIIVVMFLLLLGGVWVFCALGVAGALGIFLFGADWESALSLGIWGSANRFMLTAIPLFIFMGEIMLRSGISKSLYDGVTTWVGQLPGGLLHTNVASCALFAAISGSSVATAATMGTVAIPDQKARGYDENLTLGSLVASGTLGILIPPSISMIIYGAWMECSIAQLFAGGIIPGIIISLTFMLYIGIRCSLQPGLASRTTFSWKERLLSVRDMWPGILLIVFILSAIFAGLMTPTETAAVAATTALVLSMILRRFSLRLLYDSALNTIHSTTMILIIYVSAKILVMSLMYLGVVAAIPKLMESLGLSPLLILLAIYVIYLILGCFFDGISLLMVTLPFVLPLLLYMGTDLIWFGVVVTVLVEIGLITPPVGMNLYVIMSVSGCSLSKVTKSIFPFFCILLIAVALLTVFPQLALWLPRILLGS
ncbi:C4-dicarboxylate TRAP transporter large permease protein DctM [subsurface metagenome]